MSAYDPTAIEKKWQQRWAEQDLYTTPDAVQGRENFLLLTEFPYPSGNLHMGHWYSYAVPDMLARFLRMKGYNVLYPMGFDAFGLPAENAAIKRNVNPRDWTEQNIAAMTKQMHSMGASFDWSRRVATTDPEYYRWTQWMFNQFLRKGLAYRGETTVNWCPTDKTVLANEQVIDGKCERDGCPVEQKTLEQWMLKTTEYAKELVDELEVLDWPNSTKAAQANWIGRSRGADIIFPVSGVSDRSVTIFTTRPDTLFGCTFLVISPELAKKWMDSGWQASDDVQTYVSKALSRRELERMEREKTGVDTGVKATNPVNDEQVPVWVADYVLGSYGTGAIMAVPAHDERDLEFAKKFGLSVRQVIAPPGEMQLEERAYTGEGVLISSGTYDGLPSNQARTNIVKDLAARKLAKAKTTYKLRDWVLSRQRYWGCPIPVINCQACGYVPVPDDQLPVVLPPLDDFKPSDDGRSPLAKSKKWLTVSCPKCAGPAERETDTMDTFVDSSWYFLRYTDPHNDKRFADKEKISAWMPVPMYSGGAEHNTMHLLYSRFWIRALHELGHLEFAEPFTGRRNHGIILGPDQHKMSKSRGNVIDPDDLVKKYGTDTVRMYMAFMAPYEQGGPWDPKGINGVHRFLKRLWSYVISSVQEEGIDTPEQLRAVHIAARNVGGDLADQRFNTAVSGAMIMLNDLEKSGSVSPSTLEMVVRTIAPMAPHIAEELWRGILGNEESVHVQSWPNYDARFIQQDSIQLPVQISGKMRGTIEVAPSVNEEDAFEKAKNDATIGKYLDGVTIEKIIYVPGRMLNIVLEGY